MIHFFLSAGLLLAAAYLLFAPVLLGKGQTVALPREQLQLLLYKQRRRELGQELAQGNLDQSAYEQLCQELDLQLLSETAVDTTAPVAAPHQDRRLVVLLALPFLAYGLYIQLGRPDLLDATTRTAAVATAMQENIQRLVQRLRMSPDDLQGWMLLGRSYQAIHQTDKAQAAYEKAIALAPDDLDIKVLYAQALAEGQDNRLQGKPAQIIAEILKADPDFPNGLWLAGLVAAEEGDAKTALAHWQKLKAQYAADSEDAQQLSGYIAMLSGQPNAATAPKLSVTVRVTLAPSLLGKTQPDDTVFVFAKAAVGKPVPLAIVRKQVKDLPVEVVMDDSMAMAAGMNLSAFPQIVLGARVSKSGQAMPTAGDLQGFSEPLAPASDQSYSVEISQSVP